MSKLNGVSRHVIQPSNVRDLRVVSNANICESSIVAIVTVQDNSGQIGRVAALCAGQHPALWPGEASVSW